VVRCTICSRKEVPGERKPVIRNDDDDEEEEEEETLHLLKHFVTARKPCT
jgi:hypothetical protein